MTVPRWVQTAADRVQARTPLSARMAMVVVAGGVAAVVYTVWFLFAMVVGGLISLVDPADGLTAFGMLVLLPLLVAVYWAIWRLRTGGGAA